MTFDFIFDVANGHLTIAEGSTEILDSAFRGRDEVKSVTIPDSVTSIGNEAFSFNELTEVVIGDSVTSIGSGAFSVNELTEVVIGDSVTSIGSGAFFGNQLTEVVLPTVFEEDPPINAFDLGVTFTFSDVIDPEPEPEPEPEPDASSGELTEEGWTSSENSGTWSERRDAATEFADIDGFSLFIRDGMTVDTLDGNDKIIVFNENGNGLEVKGTLKMGDGHDLIDVSSYDSLVGIENYGKIDMGGGDDVIVSSVEKVPGDEDALINHKKINMGKGDDLIDARFGGLGGDGTIKMGKGDDEFIGFGDMKLINGGKGKDRLRLGTGTFDVQKRGKKFLLSKDIGSLEIKSFEQIGSFWSRDDEFVELDFNQDNFSMVVDQHGVTFI